MRRNTRVLVVGLVFAALSFYGVALLASTTDVRGGGGSSPEPSLLPLSQTLAGFHDLRWLPRTNDETQYWLPDAPTSWDFPRKPLVQLEFDSSIVSDGQFVWGPNVGDFNIVAYLAELDSPLEPYAADVELWASYSSVNPKVLIAVLELRYGWVSDLPESIPEDQVRSTIEDTAMSLATTFYEHLHTWGARRPTSSTSPAIGPAIQLQDGTAAAIAPGQSSGTVALLAEMAEEISSLSYESKFAGAASDFTSVFGTLFPEGDLLDSSNEITPLATPPDSLFQLPFPLGAEWVGSGPHSWNGGSWPPPYSSIDFFTGGGSCSSPPNQYAVAAAYGTVNRPYGYTCWLEIDHGGGWVTSYYHLQNLYSGAPIGRGGKVGTIACETCAGGYATGPHVHFSLKYNGAYVSLEGVKFSGWTVHVGSVPYNSGSFERDGSVLPAYSRLTNDYQVYYSGGLRSLRFYGYGADDADRLKIRLTDRSLGAPVDIGETDFTIDWWMKALPNQNNTPFAICSSSDAWRSGNIILDRDRAAQPGDYGVSIAGGRLVFGVRGPDDSDVNLCGSSSLDDEEWHHIAIQRRATDGWLWIFVDGILEAQGDGPDGDISYPNDAVPLDICDGPCVNDGYLVIGAEKHGIDPSLQSFSGWIDEFRVSDMLRYSSNFTPESQPHSTDPATVALYHFDDSPANTAYDTSGHEGGPSNGSRRVGGPSGGPEWSGDIPFGPPPTPTPTLDPSITPTVTDTPTPTTTPSSTPTSTSTATPSPTPSSTPTPSSSPKPTATSSPTPTPTLMPSETPSETPVPTATEEPTAGPSPTPVPSDLNGDGLIDVLDVQLCVNVFLGTETDPTVVERADVNADGSVDVLDVQLVVNAYLGG